VSIEGEDDVAGLAAAGRVVAEALALMKEAVFPGVSTRELDEVGAAVFAAHGARSAPRLTYGFPGTSCISVNDEAVHGVPSDRALRDGDLVTLDVTAELDGYMADAAVTVPVGRPSPLAAAIVETAERALERALGVVAAGVRLNEIGRAVEHEVRASGFEVLTALSGHGIGRTIHERPQVRNTYVAEDPTILTEGLVITIEPIIAAGTSRVSGPGADGWTLSTADGSLSAHAEHTLIVTSHGADVLTLAA
jgi:methionyl aminopeptidase